MAAFQVAARFSRNYLKTEVKAAGEGPAGDGFPDLKCEEVVHGIQVESQSCSSDLNVDSG